MGCEGKYDFSIKVLCIFYVFLSEFLNEFLNIFFKEYGLVLYVIGYCLLGTKEDVHGPLCILFYFEF